MNKFQQVFYQAIEDGLLEYKTEFEKAIGEAFHNFNFNNWLNENYTIEITENNYDSVCTYENFKSYLPSKYKDWFGYYKQAKKIKSENKNLSDRDVVSILNRKQLNDFAKNLCYRKWGFIINVIVGIICLLTLLLELRRCN